MFKTAATGCVAYMFFMFGIIMIIASFMTPNDLQAIRLFLQGMLLLTVWYGIGRQNERR